MSPDYFGIILSFFISAVFCFCYGWLIKRGIKLKREYFVDPHRMDEAIELLEKRSREAEDD